MRIVPGQTVMITGASGGMGIHITQAFAELGVKLGLVAFPGSELEELGQRARKLSREVLVICSDLREASQRREVVDRVRNELGPIDILVNNAGVEFTAPYHELSEENILDVIGVNLTAAMVLSRLVLPEMLKRGSGHIVNMSSLAGKAGPALQEPYAATKAGLVGFTFSLRATYRSQGVSASAIVPGFVEAGIYAKLKEKSGCSAPPLLGTSPPQKVARAIIRAIEGDRGEVIVNPLPVRPLLAVTALCPSLGEWLTAQTGGDEFFRKVYAASKQHSG
jgi:short-subunit dehydrogenase